MISFEGLTKRFGTVTAVASLSFDVRRGEVYSLLGPNGAGKTTTLRCLAALLRPSSGRAVVDGIDVQERPVDARRRLAFLGASAGLYERLTAREFVTYFAHLQGMAGEDADRRVDELIEMFAIGDFAHRLCGSLSTGQRQRVSLARALVHDPPAMVLDEPTLGLDVVSGRAIHDFIVRARSRGKAILLSTHRMDEVELLADRVGVLVGGRLIAEGRPEELLDRTSARNLNLAFLRLVEMADGLSEVEAEL